MLLRPLTLLLAVSPVACMKIDWQYTDHRGNGGNATESSDAVGEGEAALLVDLPAKIDLGSEPVAFKLWPVGDCEGTEDDAELSADDFPYTVVVDASCDYKMTFALGDGKPGEPVEVLGEDLADVGQDGLVVDVKLDAAQADDTDSANANDTATATATATATDTSTQPTTPADGGGSQLGIKEFRIKAGTGSGAWNDRQTPIVARVGDTIRIFNDDTTAHRLHTNGRPCPHGADIRPGGFQDCVVTQQFEGDLYDHNTNGAVFIQATR